MRSTPGRYYIGHHELVSADHIEFVDGERTVFGRIEHDGLRFIAVCSGGHRQVPLAEIVQARYMGSGSPRNMR